MEQLPPREPRTTVRLTVRIRAVLAIDATLDAAGTPLAQVRIALAP